MTDPTEEAEDRYEERRGGQIEALQWAEALVRGAALATGDKGAMRLAECIADRIYTLRPTAKFSPSPRGETGQ